MKLLIFTLLFAGLAIAQTNPSFTGPRNYLGNNSAIADFNHDGILDLATVDQGTGQIHIHAGNGNGTFAGDEALTLPMVVADLDVLATADLNGDGFPDLIVGQESPASILVFLGNADGGFTAGMTFSTSLQVLTLYLADFNLDGKVDLMCVGQGGVALALGNGNGTFQHLSVVSAQSNGSGGLAIADFNEDGKPDLALPVNNGVLILFGDGAGNFKTGTSFTTLESFGPAAAADLNGDGKQDLVLETASKGLVEVLLGNGDGTFRAPQIYFLASQSGHASNLALGDVNNDGILDIVTPDPAVLLGNGDGTFLTPVVYPASDMWGNVQLADLRGIGRLDMVGSVESGDSSSPVFLNAGGGKFGDSPVVRLTSVGSCVAVADFNGDGHDDAAASSGSGVQILLGTGHRNPALQRSATLSLGASGVVCPITGDFNNDGIPDLLVNMNNGDLAFLAGNGDGTFAQAIITTVPTAPDSLVTGDFNGDGFLDLAGVPQGIGGQIQVFFGNGAGRFSAPTSITAPTSVRGLAAGDLNGDDITDLVASTSTPGGVTVLLATGKGGFTSQTYPLTRDAYAAQIADLNGDGIPDVVAVGQSEVFIFLAQGGGAFAEPTELMAAGRNLVLTDVNGDGIPDLALDDGSEVKLFLGDGTGSFSFPGNPDGIWTGIAGSGYTLAAANLQSQTKASGLSDLITLGAYPGVGYVGELLNQAVAH